MRHAYRQPAILKHRTTPMGEMNVTPFIDVLLVLIIMLIMTVPIATHVTDIPLPNGKARPADPQINVVGVTTGGGLLWNGQPIDAADLRASVARASAMPEQPVLRFDPADTAPYDTSAKTIALIKDAGAEKFAFARLHEHRVFGKAN